MPSPKRSLLRMLVDDKLSRLSVSGLSVLELGGRKAGAHSQLFRRKGCHYLSAGFEGDVALDLNGAGIPIRAESFDVILISMVLMYLDVDQSLAKVLKESLRILRTGGRILIFEPFLYPETSHLEVKDISRLSEQGIVRMLSNVGYANPRCERLGGIMGCASSPIADLLPSFLWPLRFMILRSSVLADSALEGFPYFRKRNRRYYQGYFATGEKKAMAP